MHYTKLAISLTSLLPLLTASPLPGDVPSQGGGALNLCWGCIEESSCTGHIGELKWGEGDLDAQNQLTTQWMDKFGDSGNLPGNGDMIDRGLCCRDWCLIMENTSDGGIDYSRDDAQGAIDGVNNDGKGCSKWYQMVAKEHYLKVVAVSSAYQSGGDLQTMPQKYGDMCAGALPTDGPPPEGAGFA